MKSKHKRIEKNTFSFSKIYSGCWKYILSCKTQIYWIVSLFFAFALLGFFVPAPSEVMAFLLDYIKQIIAQTEGMSMRELIVFIFLNNLQASFMGIIFGAFFGIFPILFAIFNGYILGIVASLSVAEEGFSSLLSLFPHGIFELPAVFISLGIGLKLGAFIFQKNKLDFLQKNILESAKVFFLVVLPLLAIAAIIEGSLIFLIK